MDLFYLGILASTFLHYLFLTVEGSSKFESVKVILDEFVSGVGDFGD